MSVRADERRMAVTGVGDFVGAEICRAARAAGWTVLAYGTAAEPGPGDLGGAYYRQWDFSGRALEVPPVVDVVVHAAAYVREWGSARRAWRVNVNGTRNVARSFGAARLVHISSSSVYDPTVPSVLVREDAGLPRRYFNAFAATKAEAERVLQGRPGTVILRPHGVYGRGDTTLLPRFQKSLRAGYFPLPGGGSALHSMTSIDNLVAAVLLAAEPEAPDGIFNVADAEPIPVGDAITGILAAAGILATVVAVPSRLVRVLAALTERAWRLLRLNGEPPLTRYGISQVAMERTFDLDAARSLLGYEPMPSDFHAAAAPRNVEGVSAPAR